MKKTVNIAIFKIDDI